MLTNLQKYISSPTTYNLYINDAPETIHILTFFVDNIFIYASCREEMYAIRRLQRRPKSVEKWCEVWNSRINVYKNQAVYFCHGNGPVEFDNALKGRIIPCLNYVSCMSVIYVERLHVLLIQNLYQILATVND